MIFFIGSSNKVVTLLAVFLSSLLKRLLMMIIPLKDIEIFLGMKGIKLLQTPHPLGFNDNIYHEGNISRLPDFDVFFFSFRHP